MVTWEKSQGNDQGTLDFSENAPPAGKGKGGGRGETRRKKRAEGENSSSLPKSLKARSLCGRQGEERALLKKIGEGGRKKTTGVNRLYGIEGRGHLTCLTQTLGEVPFADLQRERLMMKS